MSATRPKFVVPYGGVRIALDALSIAGLLFIAVQLYLAWPSLPDRIPTHFGLSGQPDRWSGRIGALIAPLVAFSAWLSMTILERFPHLHNLPVEVTEENAPRLYGMSVGLLSLVKTEVVALCAYAFWTTVQVATGQVAGMNSAVFLALVGLVVVSAVGSTIRMLSAR